MNTNQFFLVVLFFLVTSVVFSFGKKEKTEEQVTPLPDQYIVLQPSNDSILDGEFPRFVKITGIVRLVGSAPFHDLIIYGYEISSTSSQQTDNVNISWYVTREEMNLLHDRQHQTVTVEADADAYELRFANGLLAGIRRELCNIRIISVN